MDDAANSDPLHYFESPRRLADLVAYQTGSIVSRQIVKTGSGSVTLFAFGAGEGLSEHTTPFDALVQVIDGKAKVTVGGETSVVGKGEVMLMPADIPHAVEAEQQFKMLLVMVKQ